MMIQDIRISWPRAGESDIIIIIEGQGRHMIYCVVESN